MCKVVMTHVLAIASERAFIINAENSSELAHQAMTGGVSRFTLKADGHETSDPCLES